MKGVATLYADQRGRLVSDVSTVLALRKDGDLRKVNKMNTKLVYIDGTIKSRKEKFITLRSFIKAYASNIPEELRDRKSKHIDGCVWYELLGIVPVARDGSMHRTCFIASELIDAIGKKGWKEDLDESDNNVEECESEEVEYSATSVCLLVCQIINQKMDYIIDQLGGKFVLDENKLVR